MRLERCQEIREDLEDAHWLAVTHGWPALFHPERPWKAVWKVMATGDHEWWTEHVRDPATFIVTGVKKLSSYIGGDAAVSSQDSGQAISLPGFYAIGDEPLVHEAHYDPPSGGGRGAGRQRRGKARGPLALADAPPTARR